MPKGKQRPRNKPQGSVEVDDGAIAKPEGGGRAGPRWLMGKNDKLRLNDLFRLARNYYAQNTWDRMQDNDSQEAAEEAADDYADSLEDQIPGQGQYVGDYSGAPTAPAGGLGGSIGAGATTDPMDGFWPTEGSTNPLVTGSGGGGVDLPLANGFPAIQHTDAFKGVPAEQAALAQKYGQQFGVDPGLLLAIAKHETNFGELGLGRRGLTLGYGAYDSGPTMKWAGHENQYRAAAERLAEKGVDDVRDVLAGKAKWWATDPAWERGIGRAYEAIIGQMSAPKGGKGKAHLGGTPLTEYGAKPVGTPIAQALQGAEAVIGMPVPVTDGYRTEAQQADGYRRKPGLVAPPGQSYHEHGLAVDVDWAKLNPEQQKALVDYWKKSVPGGTWGGDFKSKNEPWHFSIGENGTPPPPDAATQITEQLTAPPAEDLDEEKDE